MTQEELHKKLGNFFPTEWNYKGYKNNNERMWSFTEKELLDFINQHVKEVIGEKELYRDACMNGIAAATRDALKAEQEKRAGL